MSFEIIGNSPSFAGEANRFESLCVDCGNNGAIGRPRWSQKKRPLCVGRNRVLSQLCAFFVIKRSDETAIFPLRKDVLVERVPGDPFHVSLMMVQGHEKLLFLYVPDVDLVVNRTRRNACVIWRPTYAERTDCVSLQDSDLLVLWDMIRYCYACIREK